MNWDYCICLYTQTHCSARGLRAKTIAAYRAALLQFEAYMEIRDLLGHRQITSTQIYLHVTAEDLRQAADVHPISRLATTVADLLPNVKLPLQRRRRMEYG